jgi:GDP-L-fucose synthase
MKKSDKIYIAGHTGLVGSAITKILRMKGYTNIIGRTLDELDLRNQALTESFFEKEKPEYVILAAAKVGGIVANNTYRAEFIADNLQIQNNIIHQSFLHNVKKLLFLGSTCIYPRECPQPIREDYLLTGPLEYTNEPYAIAKIAGIKMCESYNIQYKTNFISVMPTNLYGPNDNFNLETSHVIPAMIRKIHLARLLAENRQEDVLRDLGLDSLPEAEMVLTKYGITKKGVEIWGTGKPLREFLWSEEMADACIFIIEKINFSDLSVNMKDIRNTHINIGTGKEISIKEVASLIKEIIGYKGELIFNAAKPDGTARKLTDVTKLHSLGWKHKVEIDEGIRKLYEWYCNSKNLSS